MESVWCITFLQLLELYCEKGVLHMNNQSKMTGERIFIMVRQNSAISVILVRSTTIQDACWLVLLSISNFIINSKESIRITLANTSLFL